jgi:L-aminopeptidase/D-esterase-like protein
LKLNASCRAFAWESAARKVKSEKMNPMKRALLAAALAAVVFPSSPAAQLPPTGLTAIAGIRVGHFTLSEKPTGCTVILVEKGATGGVDVRGSAPGTRETDLLEPSNLVDQVHAVVLSGGSAFGLDAASGVMRYLEERKVGFAFGGAYVPIVPAAVLFDLPIAGKPLIRPDASCGYEAAKSAGTGPIAEGSIGAGAGATVGKFAGGGKPMKGGIGTASITLPSGLIVAAIVAVNAGGDIIDPATGGLVAGARGPDGQTLLDARIALRSGALERPRPGENTTIGLVATNARLTKAQAKKMAEMAHDGFARAIVPAHTMGDGDTIFSIATGAHEGAPNVSLIGGLAAEMMADAILRGVRAATGLPGIPAVRDLPRP